MILGQTVLEKSEANDDGVSNLLFDGVSTTRVSIAYTQCRDAAEKSLGVGSLRSCPGPERRRTGHGIRQNVIGSFAQHEAHQLAGQAKCCATKIRQKAVGGGIFDNFFLNFKKCLPEVTNDVISAVAVEDICMDIRIKCGDDSTLNSDRVILILCRLRPFYALLCSG